MHWAVQYINKPWVAGGRGPDEFDCWGLLRYIVHKEFKRPELPLYPIPPASKLGVAHQIEAAVAGAEWRKLCSPAHSCAVGLSMGRRLHHVGFYIADDGGMVIHCAQGKRTVAQSVAALRADQWRRIEFYWNTSWLSPHI